MQMPEQAQCNHPPSWQTECTLPVGMATYIHELLMHGAALHTHTMHDGHLSLTL